MIMKNLGGSDSWSFNRNNLIFLPIGGLTGENLEMGVNLTSGHKYKKIDIYKL